MALAHLLTNYTKPKGEPLMGSTLHSRDRRKLSGPHGAATERKNLVRSPRPARRTLAFWLGGGLLGTGGLILGVCMPYHHPVAVVISALWWSIYLGCFGASVGALIGLCTERALSRVSRGVDGRS